MNQNKSLKDSKLGRAGDNTLLYVLQSACLSEVLYDLP